MAITWGEGKIGTSNVGMRLGYEVSRSGTTMEVKIYVNTYNAVDDENNTFTVSLNGTKKYNGGVKIHTSNRTNTWSDKNDVCLATFDTTDEGTISISASLTGVDIVGTSTEATLSADVINYTDGSKPSLYITDNGDNTVTLFGFLGSDGEYNKLSHSTVYYTTDGSEPSGSSAATKHCSLGSTSGAYYSKKIDIPAGCTKIIAITYCTFRCNTTYNTGGSQEANVKYYSNPGYPGTPSLSYQRKGPTLREMLTFNWSEASEGSNVPVSGYRLRLYKNDSLLTGINPNDASASYWDTDSTDTTFSFDPIKFGFKVGDTVKLGIYAYGFNGANTVLWSGGGNGPAQVFSLDYTFINAGIVRLKVNGVWKEGQVYVKVNGVWKEADSVYIKNDGSWKESI